MIPRYPEYAAQRPKSNAVEELYNRAIEFRREQRRRSFDAQPTPQPRRDAADTGRDKADITMEELAQSGEVADIFGDVDAEQSQTFSAIIQQQVPLFCRHYFFTLGA